MNIINAAHINTSPNIMISDAPPARISKTTPNRINMIAINVIISHSSFLFIKEVVNFADLSNFFPIKVSFPSFPVYRFHF